LAHEHAVTNGQKTKNQFDKHVQPYSFHISDKVLVANDFNTTQNPKLVPNWKGLAEIIDINDTNAKIKIKNKIKVLNGSKLKHFFKNIKNSEEKEDANGDFNQTPDIYRDIFNQAQPSGPITRVQAKLIKYKDAAQLSLILLKNEESPKIDSLCDPSDHCAECESKDTYFENQNTLQGQWCQLKLAEARCKQWRLWLMKKEANLINSTDERCHSTVPGCFHEPLMKVAYKLLSRDEATFEELTSSKKKLWTFFKQDQIY
jgi:hypothetical protein